ncbi:virulence protein, partial [Thioalkalivibrio halophilus]
MSGGELILYRSEDGKAEMAELFQTSVPNINTHVRNILESGELSAEATIKENLIVRQEGTRQVRRELLSKV